MSYIKSQKENPNGFHRRYQIKKVTKDGLLEQPDPHSEYFVLRLDEGGRDKEHIKACRIAINAYADAIEHHLPFLAKELKEFYPLIQTNQHEAS